MVGASVFCENVAEQDAAGSTPAVPAKAVEDRLIDGLVSRAQAGGLQLTGGGGLLPQSAKRLLGPRPPWKARFTGHLGYDTHDPAGENGGGFRSGERSRTVVTDVGAVEAAMPMVVSPAAEGLTTGEVQAHWPRSVGPITLCGSRGGLKEGR